jgi:hypothetical protein
MSSATVVPAEPAISKVGTIIFTPSSTLIMEIGGTLPGGEHDQIEASGVIAANGTLQVTLINSFTPIGGQSFDLFEFAPGNMVGTFSAVNVPTLTGLAWDTTNLYTSGSVSVTATPIQPGDFNQDGAVDTADYVAWRKGLVAFTSTNYTAWRENFGEPNGGVGNAAAHSAPEPAILALLIPFSTSTHRLSRRRFIARPTKSPRRQASR